MAENISKPVRVAVVGTGSLGQHHARIYAELAAAGAVEFAGVLDHQAERAQQFAAKFNTRAFTSLNEVIAACDAASIVTPTTSHYAVAKEFLEAGKDVLIEKPITNDLAQARELVELAARKGRLIQVGHIERFNPVVGYLREAITHPRFIEAERLSPHPGRGADVGVVLDLMIHDLDIVLSLVDAPVASVDAVGAAVLSQAEDLASARIKFANGCVAQLTASRVNAERVRKVRVYQSAPEARSVSLDFRAQTGSLSRVGEVTSAEATVVSEFDGKKIVREVVPITKAEPLKKELEHFVECVRTRRAPLVDGTAGIRALELAMEITRQVQASAR